MLGKEEVKKKKKSIFRIILKFFFGILIAFALLILAIIGLDYYGIIDFPSPSDFGLEQLKMPTIDSSNDSEEDSKNEKDDDMNDDEDIDIEEYAGEHLDADAYYAENSTIVEEIQVNDSGEVQSEKEVKKALEERGFTEYPISYEYSIDSEYIGENDVSEYSDERHPIYQTYYVASNSDIWSIVYINGTITANPISYNLQSEENVPVLITEENTVTAFDSKTKKFYIIIPNDSVVDVKVVDRIDANTLDNFELKD